MNKKVSGILNKFSLWPHQRHALGKIETYLDAFSKGTTEKSALVQMPTGSGKSGVIAIVARCLPDIGAVLVLTPRVSLRNQLCRDIQGRFFGHIKYPVENLPKTVQRVDDGEVPSLEGDTSRRVYVTTIQKLVSLASNQPALFKKLASVLSLVIVDEGHYEPAKEWSKVIRAVCVPKVVFTATPYRNDFKVFDIDPEHAYVMSLRQAVRDLYLREVHVENRGTFRDPADFVADVLAFYDSQFPEPGDDPPRVIIRCDDRAEIRHLAQAFIARCRSVVGIHERFRNQGGEEWERKSVPEPEKEPAVFWIHQFKLLEGIDDPRFRVLALYRRIRNGRALVQQVGRIIRNPSQEKNAHGYLLDHWKGHHEDLWRGFLAYDEALDTQGIEAFHLSTGEGLLKDLMKLQPRTAYIDGRFRSEFEFSSIDPNEDVQLPLRTNLLLKLPGFNLDEAVDALKDLYEDKDRVAEAYSPTPGTRVVLSVTCSNSIYLRNHAFMEADLHVAVLHEFDEYVGVYETSGITPMNWDAAGLGACVDIKRLRRLFKQDQLSRLTSVSLKNSNLGASVIRSRSITAASIEATVPGFDDYAQICTTAEGYTVADSDEDNADGSDMEAKVRRYVGFSRGHVTQTSSGYVLISDYLAWLKQLDSILNSNTKPLTVLSRYALETRVPSKPDPKSVLLDISEVRDGYHHTDSGTAIEIEDACSAVDDNGAVSFVANGEVVSGRIMFDPTRRRYVLESADLDQRFFTKSEVLPGSIVQYFNQQQAFRVVPEEWRTVYVSGQFYQPAMRVGEAFDASTYELGRCFLPDPTVGATQSEKGASVRNNGEGWEHDSLFGIIDALGANTTLAAHFGLPGILVCDDMGREAADFFLCEASADNPRVVLIHAKASTQNHVCSASALHDVCSQAVKNLGYLAMFSQERPARVASNGWARPWRHSDIGVVSKRIRRGTGTSAAIWKKIQETVNNPMVQKEVWLSLGQILSRKAFEEKLGKKTPPAEALQAAYLLHATMTDVAAVGGRLRIICGP
jgi:hypothetical protein